MAGEDNLVPPDSAGIRTLLTTEDLRRWNRPEPWRVTLSLALIWVQVLGGLALYYFLPGPWTFLAAFVTVAAGQHGMGLAGHEFVHYLVVPGNRRLNDRLGTWLFCAPIGLPLALYRYRHFVHHRTYSTAADTKTIYRHSIQGRRLWIEMLRSLTGFEYAYRAFESIGRDLRDRQAGEPVPDFRQTLPPLVVSQLVIFGLFSLWNPWLYFALWIAPLVTVYNLLHKFRSLMEHRPLPPAVGQAPGSGYYQDTAGPFVRTVRSNLLERFLITKINFHYHVEHHLWPSVSYQYLPLVHARLQAAGAFQRSCYGLEDSYLATIVRLWRDTGGDVAAGGRPDRVPA